VQLDEPLGRRARAAMQPVDVLRDDGDDFSCALERDDRVVQGVRLRTLIDVPRLELVVPVLDACFLGCEELVVVHRTPPRPDAAGPAEVGDAARRRHAGAGKDEDPLRSPQPVGEIHDGEL